MQKRSAVEHVVGMGQGNRIRAYRVFGLARSSAYYRTGGGAETMRKEGLIEEASRANPVYGYRKVTALLSQSGETISKRKRSISSVYA